MQLAEKGQQVLDRAEGGRFKVGDKAMIDLFEDMTDNYPLYPGIIKKLYYRVIHNKKREFADVEFENGSLLNKCMTMFMEKG